MRRAWYQLTEVPAATQVRRNINLLGRVKKWASQVRVRSELRRGASAVTAIALGLYIDNVAAESHQVAILTMEIELHRSGLKASLDPASSFTVVVVVCLDGRFTHQAECERYPSSQDCCIDQSCFPLHLSTSFKIKRKPATGAGPGIHYPPHENVCRESDSYTRKRAPTLILLRDKNRGINNTRESAAARYK